jgi:uncharacterized protein YggE
MPKSMSLMAIAFGLLLAAPAAQAQTPSTLTASGFAEARVKPENRKSETSIREAVAAARAEALPEAIANAKTRAQELATAGGVTLGALVSLSDVGAQPYSFSPYGYGYGTFGYDKYCGQVANTKTVIRDGRRRRVRVKGTHRVCRVPARISAVASVTFAIS